MPNSNNIKDALIKNNTMIANELKTNFAKKSEVSELATDKVDKETDNHYGSGQPSSTATISNVTGAVTITSTGTNPNEIKLEKRHGSSTLDSQGDYRNTIAIGNGDELILESKSNINGSEFQTNSIIVAPDEILVERDLFDGDDHDITSYNLMTELNKVEVLDDLTDYWIENGIDDFDFNKVFSGDDNVISSQTITFGASGNYKSLLDLSKFVFSADGSGNNYDYNDETNATRTRFANRTQNNPLRIPIKRGGVLTIASGSSTNIKATITVNNSSTTVTSLPYSTAAANYDQYITILFTSTITENKFTQMTVTNFVNVYITENKLRANYYNKSETDALIASQIIPGINAQVWDSTHDVERNIIDFDTNDFEIKLHNHIGGEDSHQLIMNHGGSDGYITLSSDFGTDAPYNKLQIERGKVTLDFYQNNEGSVRMAYIKEGEYDTNDNSKFGMKLYVEKGSSYYSTITLDRDNIDIYSHEGAIDIGSEYNQVRLVSYASDDSSILTLGNGSATLSATDSVNISASILKVSKTAGLQFSSDGGATWGSITPTAHYTLALGTSSNNFWFATITAESGLDGTYVGSDFWTFVTKYARYVSWYYENSSDTSNDSHKMCTIANPGQTLVFYLADGTNKITQIPTQYAYLTVTKTN